LTYVRAKVHCSVRLCVFSIKKGARGPFKVDATN
jgi:hypothetical protein